MFWKKKIEDNKKIELIKEINEAVSTYRSQLFDFARETNEDLPASLYVWDIFRLLDWKQVDSFRYESYTLSELTNMRKELDGFFENVKVMITSYWLKAEKNKEELSKIFEKGVPLFIKLTSIGSGKVTYAMCYEFKRYDDDKYQAYVFTDNDLNGKIIDFSYLDYGVEQMTEVEFEQYYVMDRLRLMSFKHENDAIEYDNELRRLFHGQREII